LRGKGIARGVEHVDERALADLKTQQIGQQPRQPFEADALREAQRENESAQVGSKRRARRHIGRRLRLEPFGAARADAAVQGHARHLGLDVGNFDMVVSLAGKLRPAGHVGSAMLAGRSEKIALRGRIGMQRPMRARMRLALGLVRRLAGGLASLARRRRGIVRRLRRQAQFGLQLGDPGGKLFNPRQKRSDQRVLVGRVERAKIRRRGHP
jgi:hypothetical protein